jgi:cysteine desulfurase
VTVVPVDGQCRVDPRAVAGALRPDTVLISVMHANNEVGTVQPIAEIAAAAHGAGALMHTDAAQSVGKIPVRVDELGVDLLSVAGHKCYGPKGVGALYVRDGVALENLVHGAGQEDGRRAGTENVILAVGLGEAAALAAAELDEEQPRLAAQRDRLQAALLAAAPDAVVHAGEAERLPNTLSIGFPGLLAADLMAKLDGIACSAGAACHAGGATASAVLVAMGVPHAAAVGTLRLSAGRFTTDEEIDRAAALIAAAVADLR